MADMGFKDITITDNGRDVKFRIFKMDCVSAQNWLIDLGCVLASAGIKLPKAIAESLAELGAMVSRAAEEGYIFQMPGLKAESVRGLCESLYPWMQVVTSDGHLLKVDRDTVKGHLSSPFKLFALQSEVIKYTYGFFDIGAKLTPGRSGPLSGSQSAETSSPSSPSSSEEKPRRLTS